MYMSAWRTPTTTTTPPPPLTQLTNLNDRQCKPDPSSTQAGATYDCKKRFVIWSFLNAAFNNSGCHVLIRIKFLLQEQQSRREFVASYVVDLAKDAVLADQKRAALRSVWPQVLREMVQTAVIDMWDSTAYMKKCLEELEKTWHNKESWKLGLGPLREV